MDDLDEFISEHMKNYGLRLAWPERLAIRDQSRAQVTQALNGCQG